MSDLNRRQFLNHTALAGAALGTLDFLAPEQQADGSKADARSDQFSLGATLYFTLTGKPPRVIRERDIPAAPPRRRRLLPLRAGAIQSFHDPSPADYFASGI